MGIINLGLVNRARPECGIRMVAVGLELSEGTVGILGITAEFVGNLAAGIHDRLISGDGRCSTNSQDHGRGTTTFVKPQDLGRRWVMCVISVLLVLLPTGRINAQSERPEDPAEEATAPEGGKPEWLNRFASRLSPDEPLYFILGWHEGSNAKIQLSFKYRFVNPDPDRFRSAPFFSRVYFGYTQTSLWDLESDSKPFYDTSYRPSLFARHERLATVAGGRGWWWGQAGVEHESNGQSGDQSHSLNIMYVQPVLELDLGRGGPHLTFAPRLWAYIGELDENPDIAEYRGYGQLYAAVTGLSEWQLALTGRMGTAGRGSIQVDFTCPMDRLSLRAFEAYLHVQFFDGWGESLRSYDQRLPWQLRVGIAVVR
jgi:outer membrane phospholipase A